jgi:hypothetical protein
MNLIIGILFLLGAVAIKELIVFVFKKWSKQ